MTALTYACALARHFEGCRLSPYQDPAGYWTIGYGERFLINGDPVTAETAPVTQDIADSMLADRMDDAMLEMKDLVPVPLSPAQQGALADFVYNLGVENFRFSTLRRCLEQGDYEGAAAQFPLWDKAHVDGVLTVLPGLTKRRAAEAYLFTHGKLPPDITA